MSSLWIQMFLLVVVTADVGWESERNTHLLKNAVEMFLGFFLPNVFPVKEVGNNLRGIQIAGQRTSILWVVVAVGSLFLFHFIFLYFYMICSKMYICIFKMLNQWFLIIIGVEMLKDKLWVTLSFLFYGGYHKLRRVNWNLHDRWFFRGW